jgi:hypothetical protein
VGLRRVGICECCQRMGQDHDRCKACGCDFDGGFDVARSRLGLCNECKSKPKAKIRYNLLHRALPLLNTTQKSTAQHSTALTTLSRRTSGDLGEGIGLPSSFCFSLPSTPVPSFRAGVAGFDEEAEEELGLGLEVVGIRGLASNCSELNSSVGSVPAVSVQSGRKLEHSTTT